MAVQAGDFGRRQIFTKSESGVILVPVNNGGGDVNRRQFGLQSARETL